MKVRWGTIGFDQYKIDCIIGTHDHERIRSQEIRVDLKVELDIAAAAVTDDLNNAVNYVQLAQLCEKKAVEGQYQLLEAYAAAVLDEISENFPIRKAWIRVCKPEAIAAANYAFVEVTKE
jgi:dihydroneopterin aldolase